MAPTMAPGTSSPSVEVDLEDAFELSPQVSLRPEPFGALAYHFGNRRLTFLRSPDMVRLVRELEHHPSAAAALSALGIDARRWPSFRKALTNLVASEMLRVRAR